MAQTNPILIALLFIVLVVAVIVIIMLIVGRQTPFSSSSTPTTSNCLAAPATPSGLTVNNPQGDLITLDWNDIASATEYVAYIGNTPGFSIGAALSTKTTKFSSTSFANLALGFTYYFKVKSVNSCGESALSAEVSYNLAFIFPSRFVIASRLDTAIELCDNHTNIYFPDDRVSARRFCTTFGSWAFYQNTDQTIRQSDRPGYCLTRVLPDNIYYAPCVPAQNEQKWAYNAQDNTLCSVANPNAGCLNRIVPLSDTGFAKWGAKSTDAVSDWTFQPV